MTPTERKVLKAEKSKWKKNMRALYPDFMVKQWGRSTYRFNHPQGTFS